MELKREKEKLNRKIQEKDLLINKLMNEKSSNDQDLMVLIDSRVDILKKEIQTSNENSKSPQTDSQNNPRNKIKELQQKLDTSSQILLDLASPFQQVSLQRNAPVENCNDKNHLKLLQSIEREKSDFKSTSLKHEESQKELNMTISKIKSEAMEIIKKYEHECNSLRTEKERLEKTIKKLRKEHEEKIQENAKDADSKTKEINDFMIENEALANEIGKLIQEKTNILEMLQLNEEKYEKIIKALEDEKKINQEKCAALHKNYNLIHDHSNVKIHKCEKEIELKIAEIHHLNEQVNILGNKMQEEKNKKLNLSEEKEALLESKNQEIINLKIDLNKMESKIQTQTEEMIKLERNHSIKMESFDVVLEDKENEIFQLKKELKEAEEQMIEERRKIQSPFDGTCSPILSPEEKEEQKREEKEIDQIKGLEAENEKLKKELRVVKKSLRETLDLNDVFSRDLQKLKHKSKKNTYIWLNYFLSRYAWNQAKRSGDIQVQTNARTTW